MDIWRDTTHLISKYNPAFRDENGVYLKDEWLGFFQIGETIGGELLTLEKYLEVEGKYVQAAKLFFEYHGCKEIRVCNIERHHWSDFKLTDYELTDIKDLRKVRKMLRNDIVLSVDFLEVLVKLALRGLSWFELFCADGDEIAVRFGYDFYMYFNSNKKIDELLHDVELKIGLFVR